MLQNSPQEWVQHRDTVGRVVFDIGSSHFDESKAMGKLRKALHNSYIDSKVNILSWEALSGPTSYLNNDALLLRFIQNCIGKTKILIVLRNQYEFLYSLWADRVRVGHSDSLKKFLRPHLKNWWWMKYKSVFKKMLYDKYTSVACKTFGEERVKVMFLEDLKRSPNQFIEEIGNFVGAPLDGRSSSKRRSSLDPASIFVFRLFNSLAETPREPGLMPSLLSTSTYWKMRRRLESDTFLSKIGAYVSKPDVRALIPENVKEEIRKSNQRLSELLSRDLGEIGYDM